MTILNINNFYENIPEIQKSLKDAKFISIDLEFSALYPLKNPSLFDSPYERYYKLKTNLAQVIPIQVGITAFNFDPNCNRYHGKVYNFNVLPGSFPTVQRTFFFQSSTLSFLKLHKFDFNELVYLGIPYLNKKQEIELRERLKNNEISENQISCLVELETICEKFSDIVKAWHKDAKEGDQICLPEVYEKYKYNFEMLYFIHKHFRRRFKYVWTAVEDNKFVLKYVPVDKYKIFQKTADLEEELINNLLGFTQIFRLLVSLRKPLIGHNLLQDILLLISSFETTLPRTYSEFKKLTTTLFPLIFDTKTISYELKNSIPEGKCWPDTGLETLFEFFKNGAGRHLAINSPAITLDQDDSYGKFHQAGWDSFCTGYIFIRLAHLNLHQKFPKSQMFMSSELIGGLSHFKNRVNVIRGAVSSIKIDGDDPASTRPPFLVIESIKNKPVDIFEVSSILSSFGFVELRRLARQNNRALIAVDNYASARRILNNFKTHNEFQVKQYSAIKHSPVVRAFIFSGITVSGAIVLWLAHQYYK